MTKRSKPVRKENGKGWDKNNAKAKSGLNKAILDKGWHKLESYTGYKAFRGNKVIFKIQPIKALKNVPNVDTFTPIIVRASLSSCVLVVDTLRMRMLMPLRLLKKEQLS
ncbi:MAG: hypothetical protein ACI86H_002847 [bacterium]|jgi:hypothetical protein